MASSGDGNESKEGSAQDFYELSQGDLALDNALTTTWILDNDGGLGGDGDGDGDKGDSKAGEASAPTTAATTVPPTTKEPDGFALIEDWDGTLIFGHIDEERHLNDLLGDIPRSTSNDSSSSSSSDDDAEVDAGDGEAMERDETGDTTDEDMPTLPHGIAAIQATQFTPAPSPTPKSSPAKEGRKPPMGHFQNELRGEIQRVAREGVPSARFTSHSNQATNAHSIIIDHKNKPVPSPYRDFYLVGREKRRAQPRQRRSSSDSEEEEKEEEERERSASAQASGSAIGVQESGGIRTPSQTPQPIQPQSTLSIDDLIDTSSLTETQAEHTDSDAHLSRWDRIPIGAFSMSQSDFEKSASASPANATNPHLLASARNSTRKAQRHSSKSRPSLPSPLLFPSDGSGQGEYGTPRKREKKGKDLKDLKDGKEEGIPGLSI